MMSTHQHPVWSKVRKALALLLLVAHVPAMAQQATMRVVSFEASSFDMSAQNTARRMDVANGIPFALIKVTSAVPNDDLRAYHFDFGWINSEIDAVNHDDGLYVYVQKGAKQVTITRQGYAKIEKYPLGMTLQAGGNYTMILSTTGPRVLTQIVSFELRPADAKAAIFIKAEQGSEEMFGVADDNGVASHSLPFGTYTYRITSSDYLPAEGRFTLNSRRDIHTEAVTLLPNYAEVTLKGAADDVDILLDGQQLARGSWSGRLAERPEPYHVECQRARHKPATAYINVKRGEAQTVTLPAPTPITGIIGVITSPSGATIELDGKEVGTTPMNIPDVIIGRHQITLRRANHQTETRTVEVEEDQTTAVEVALSDMTRMTIASTPSQARLSINGKDVGRTPYSADMASGDYDLRLTLPHYRTYSRRVHLDSSNPQLTLSLQRQRLTPMQAYAYGMFQAGSMTAAGGGMGAYIGGINIDVSYGTGLQESETVYWNNASGTVSRPRGCTYKANAIGVRAGYGIILGTSARLTPQAGATIVRMKSDDGDSKGHAVAATVGLRAEYAVLNHLALFAAPELFLPVQKSDVYEQVADISSTVKGWSSGFNVRLGLSLVF